MWEASISVASNVTLRLSSGRRKREAVGEGNSRSCHVGRKDALHQMGCITISHPGEGAWPHKVCQSGVSKETEAVGGVCVCVILRNWLMKHWASLKPAGQVGRLETQGKVEAAARVWSNLEAESPPSWGPQSFLAILSSDWVRPTHTIERAICSQTEKCLHNYPVD
jgi:hypothetical protein